MGSRKKPDNKQNLATEKDGLKMLMAKEPTVFVPTKEEKLVLLKLMNLDPKKFSRSFDAVRLKVRTFQGVKSLKDFEPLEVKVTGKNLENFPAGFFFGITENEVSLLKKFEPNFKLCLVSTHGDGAHCFLTHTEFNKLIKNKRVQYQVNL